MMRQIKVLTKLELANFFSLNVIRHTKDKKVRNTSVALGITIGVLLIMAVVYIGGMSYGFIKLGAEEIVPAYIVFMSSIFTLLFCAFKAGKIIFKEGCYDILASMPIRKSDLVISRYIRLYVEGLAVACVVMLPGIAVYVAMVQPGLLAVILGLLSVAVVPVIPVTLSVLIGVLITGISSRMKNKALFETFFVIAIVVAIFGTTAVMPTEDAQGFDMHAIENVAKDLLESINNIYPPTAWFADALGEGSIAGFVVATLISVVVLATVTTLTTIYFEKINRQIHTNTARNDFRLGELQNKSMMKALVAREAKRYFSSGTYVTNTIIGPVMAVIFAISLLFVDLGVAFESLPITMNVNAIAPVLFAGIMVINSPIATSVSMEGKEFWIIRTLPVLDRDILKSKLMFSIILLAPFYVVGEVVMIIALKPSFAELVWMIILPVVLTLCALEIGLAVNLKFPKLKWDSEVEVVKQSASALIGGLGGILVTLATVVPLVLCPMKFYNLASCGVCVVIVIITIVVNRNIKFDLQELC